jgi:hypothetical protein
LIPGLESFVFADSMLSIWLGSVLRIVWKHFSILLCAGLLLVRFANEALWPTERQAPARFRWAACLGDPEPVRRCLRRIWYFFPRRLDASVHLILFIISMGAGFPRQCPMSVQPGERCFFSHASQATSLRGDISYELIVTRIALFGQ